MGDKHRILIVEDEPLISMMLEDFLISIGHDVHGICESLEETHQAIDAGGFDLAIVDVNLKGQNVWPAAARLHQNGHPFIIATGGHVDPPPPEFSQIPVLSKPYTIDRVRPLIDAALAPAG